MKLIWRAFEPLLLYTLLAIQNGRLLCACVVPRLMHNIYSNCTREHHVESTCYPYIYDQQTTLCWRKSVLSVLLLLDEWMAIFPEFLFPLEHLHM